MSGLVLDRKRYRSNGRINLLRFVPLAALAIAAAVGLAEFILFVRPHFFDRRANFIVPFLALIAVAGLQRLAVLAGHCRNRTVAALLGVSVTLIVAIGPDFLGLMRLVGWQYASRLDLLVYYIGHHDLPWNSPGVPPRPAVQSRDEYQGDMFDCWFPVGIVGAFGLWICGLIIPRQAHRVFCDRCGRWSRRTASFFPSGTSALFAQAIESGDWNDPALEHLMPRGCVGARERTYATAVLQYCPDRLTGNDACPIYFSAGEAKFGGGITQASQLDHGHSGGVAPVELCRAELPLLSRLFPAIENLCDAGKSPRPKPRATLPAGTGAEVQPIPDTYRRRILTKKNILLGNVIGIGAALGVIALLPLGIGLIALAFYPGKNFFDLSHLQHLELAGGIAMILSFAFLVFFVLRSPSALPNKWLRRKVVREFSTRPDAAVRPEDTGVYFVEIVPREHWGRIMAETATDIGFLCLDHDRDELRFEGDVDRYRIPLASIRNCEIALASATTGNVYDTKHFATVILATTRDGSLREFSFCHRITSFRSSNRVREQAARELMNAITPHLVGWMPHGFEVREVTDSSQ